MMHVVYSKSIEYLTVCPCVITLNAAYLTFLFVFSQTKDIWNIKLSSHFYSRFGRLRSVSET